ncbi:MAG: VWA domain-containing protein [Muribaculaceae bacterium]|nr:VWA domain-containing protein [Muribaculaceae bacterium]
MQFAHPQYLWLFLIFIPIIAWYVFRKIKSHPTLSVSTLSPYAKLPVSFREYLIHLLFVLRLGVLACVIIIIARPQTYDSWRTSSTHGTDIILAMDISSSMLARDFKPDRLEAAKNVAAKFVSGREADNIGIVVFAGESFTAVPMTTDRSLLVNYINDISMNMLEDGTAIGDGLATSINRIKDGKAKSKSIILLTDGSNNTGNVAPSTAAEIAKKFGIKVYTIGVGKNGEAPFPQQNMFGRIEYVNMPVVIDEETLKNIASITGGKYFRATNNNVLADVFEEIDKLEKTQMDVKHFSHTEDNYMMWAVFALGLFLLEIILRNTVLRTIP